MLRSFRGVKTKQAWVVFSFVKLANTPLIKYLGFVYGYTIVYSLVCASLGMMVGRSFARRGGVAGEEVEV